MVVRTLSFSIVDYVIFVLTLVASGGIGIYYAFRKEAWLGGKDLPIGATAISLMASFVSGVSLLGFPAEIYTMGTTMCWLTIGGMFAVIITAFVIAPAIRDVEGLSVYRYFERRFGTRILRFYGSILFTLGTLFWDSVALYAPSVALAGVTGVPVWVMNLSIGLVCTIYTAIGGLKTVVWTDALQAVLMYGGLIAVIIKGSISVGGFNQVWDTSKARGRLDGIINVEPNPFQYMNIWAAFFGGGLIWLSHYGANQLSLQRIRTMSSLKKAKIVVMLNIPILLSIYGLIYYMSLLIFTYYADCDPLKAGYVESRDQIVVHFMLDVCYNIVGLPGLMLACICSATLSTISSGIHALASVALDDFVLPNFPNMKEANVERLSKAIAISYGAIIIAFSFAAEPLGGVFQACIKLLGALDGPLIGLFLLGILVPFANATGALIGIVCGCSATMTFFIKDLVTNRPYPYLPTSIEECSNVTNSSYKLDTYPENHSQLSYMLYPVVGCVGVLLVGSVASIIVRLIMKQKFQIPTRSEKEMEANVYQLGELQKKQ